MRSNSVDLNDADYDVICWPSKLKLIELDNSAI
jgi:hypothetical protein